jgi:hypothetical protein
VATFDALGSLPNARAESRAEFSFAFGVWEDSSGATALINNRQIWSGSRETVGARDQ